MVRSVILPISCPILGLASFNASSCCNKAPTDFATSAFLFSAAASCSPVWYICFTFF